MADPASQTVIMSSIMEELTKDELRQEAVKEKLTR